MLNLQMGYSLLVLHLEIIRGPCLNASLTAAGSDFSHVVDDFPLSGVRCE